MSKASVGLCAALDGSGELHFVRGRLWAGYDFAVLGAQVDLEGHWTLTQGMEREESLGHAHPEKRRWGG